MSDSNKALDDLRRACEESLWIYAQTIEPHRCYGLCHKEIYEWWQQCEILGITNTLCLIPRDHQKSHMIAVWCAWQIVRDPSTTIIYLSATSELATRQLDDIGNILTSDIHMLLWPALVNAEKGKRTQWNDTEITVDHPKRKEEGIRDPTVSTAGLTTVTTGWHCKILIKDDTVVPENAYTPEGRAKVEAKSSQLSSVLTNGGLEWVVGTRYHPDDHYNTLLNMYVEQYNEVGEIVGRKKLYAVHERVVEVNGIFLWPREPRKTDGKLFGFDLEQLAIKKAKYTDTAQFRAQYYNDCTGGDEEAISPSMFEYYNREKIQRKAGKWYYGERELSVICCIDFAYSTSREADFTCVITLGKDYEHNIYVLDIIRFKTDDMDAYFRAASSAHDKWKFKKMRAEATAAQQVIVNTLKTKFEENGYVVKIFDFKPHRTSGSKEERMKAALVPAYREHKVYHYRGGECLELEEELKKVKPAHDDVKDVLAQGVSWEDWKAPRPPADDDELTAGARTPYKRGTRFGGYR